MCNVLLPQNLLVCLFQLCIRGKCVGASMDAASLDSVLVGSWGSSYLKLESYYVIQY